MATLRDYLADDEELLLSFNAEKVEHVDDDSPDFHKNEYEFGATDRRIVYLNDSGSFKDIDYGHISSIESEKLEQKPTSWANVAIVGGAILVIAGVGGLFSEPPNGSALLLVPIGAALIWYGVNREDNREIVVKEKIKFVTGDESHQQVEATIPPTPDSEFGPEMSRILREQRG